MVRDVNRTHGRAPPGKRFGARIVMGSPAGISLRNSSIGFRTASPNATLWLCGRRRSEDNARRRIGGDCIDTWPYPGNAVDVLRGNGWRPAPYGSVFGRHGIQFPERRAAFRHLCRLATPDSGACRREERDRAVVGPLRIRQRGHEDQIAGGAHSGRTASLRTRPRDATSTVPCWRSPRLRVGQHLAHHGRERGACDVVSADPVHAVRCSGCLRQVGAEHDQFQRKMREHVRDGARNALP
jgi:hypothetical protein